jgi:hypothetical protein
MACAFERQVGPCPKRHHHSPHPKVRLRIPRCDPSSLGAASHPEVRLRIPVCPRQRASKDHERTHIHQRLRLTQPSIVSRFRRRW